MSPASSLSRFKSLAALLVGATVFFAAPAGAIGTLADAGWWSGYTEGPAPWSPPARLGVWRDQIVFSSRYADPLGHDNPGFFAWDGQAWRKLHGAHDPDQERWCVWQDRVVAFRSDANQVVGWDGADWQPLGAPLPGPLQSMTSADGRLLVSTTSAVYEWTQAEWRGVGPPATLGFNQLLLVHGEPTVLWKAMSGISTGTLRLHEGAWRSLPPPPAEGWGSDRPGLVIAGRLHAGYVAPDFATGSPHSRVVVLEGDRWTPVGDWIPGVIDGLFDDRGQPAVTTALKTPGLTGSTPASAGVLMRWTGEDWIPTSELTNGPIRDVAVTEAGPVVLGEFTAAGTTRATGIARLENGLWRPLRDMSQAGPDGPVRALLEYRGELVVAGGFVTLGGLVHSGLARGDGRNWYSLADGTNDAVFTLTEFQGDLVAAGDFTKAGDAEAARVARWDGSAWHPLGAGFDDRVQALGTYHGELYAGGWFRHSGARECRGIARWDGATWVPVAGGVDNHVTSFAVFNDELVVGGEFRHAGGLAARYLARYDGAAWRAMPAEVNGGVLALTTWRERLVAGGRFHRAGTVTAPAVAFWDGTTWSAPTEAGSPPQSWAISLGAWQGDLVVGWDGGDIPAPFPANNFALWNGRDWRVPETVATGAVRAVAQFGPSLFIGGEFTKAGGHPAQNIARWDGTLVGAPPAEATAFRSGAVAELGWAAPGVSNHTGYEIWRESDGTARVKIGFVAAAADGRYAFSDPAPVAGAADYWLRELGPLGDEAWRGPISLAPLPAGVQLRAPTPNPFRGSTTLGFTMERAGRIGLDVYDVQGRHVRALLDETRPAGIYAQEWDGRADDGAMVASGFYWLRLSSSAGSVARRVLYLR